MKIMIGNMFDSSAKTLVNTVNCVGIMGKGIALEFKKRYPDMFKDYVQMCNSRLVKPGVPYLYSNLYGVSIINFPTKDHWRSPSKLSYIIDGLNWFRANYKELGITSIAFPPLGCGNGGLSWSVIGPLMYEKMHDLPIEVEIYAPFGTKPEELTTAFLERNNVHSPKGIIGSKSLPFNKYWYLILYTIQQLNNDRYSLSVGRTIFQKVCYILTRFGIPTGFTFVEGSYGPYSKEVKSAVTVLSNANLMTECQLGKMIETVVAQDFELQTDLFSADELEKTNRAIDLLMRIKSTDHAELIATVLFSYDELCLKNKQPTDLDVFNHVLSWKPHWKGKKDAEIRNTVYSLCTLHYMTPVYSGELIGLDDDV